MLAVRGSEVQDFLRCRLRWEYAWRRRLVPKQQDGKLLIGNLIHKWLEVYYLSNKDRADQAMEELFQQSGTEEQADLYDLAQKIVDNYYNTYANDNPFIVLATELTFRIKISRNIIYTGTIDLIGLDAENRLFFMDHKTTKSLEKYEKNAIMDRQISRYWWVLDRLCQGKGEILLNTEGKNVWVPTYKTALFYQLQGKRVNYFLYNIILKDCPEPPRQLKKGGLSKDKGQNTSYRLYLKEIERLGLNPEDYQDMLEWLKENEKPFFKRVEVVRNKQELTAAMREFYYTALDLADVRSALELPGNKLKAFCYRNITSDCYWDCAFKDVCIAGMDGSNVDFLLNTLYDVREEEIYD